MCENLHKFSYVSFKQKIFCQDMQNKRCVEYQGFSFDSSEKGWSLKSDAKRP